MQSTIQFPPSVDPQWKDAMIRALQEYLCNQDNGYTFMIEDFRVWAEKKGLRMPAEKRNFGHVVTEARRLSLVRSVGVAKVKNPNANKAYATVWAKI